MFENQINKKDHQITERDEKIDNLEKRIYNMKAEHDAMYNKYHHGDGEMKHLKNLLVKA